MGHVLFLHPRATISNPPQIPFTPSSISNFPPIHTTLLLFSLPSDHKLNFNSSTLQLTTSLHPPNFHFFPLYQTHTKFPSTKCRQLVTSSHLSGVPRLDHGDGVPSTFANRGRGFTSFGDALSYSCARTSNFFFWYRQHIYMFNRKLWSMDTPISCHVRCPTWYRHWYQHDIDTGVRVEFDVFDKYSRVHVMFDDVCQYGCRCFIN